MLEVTSAVQKDVNNVLGSALVGERMLEVRSFPRVGMMV